MRSQPGMTARLILWLTAATVLLWVIAVGMGGLVIKDEFDEVFDSSLKETAQRLLPLLVEDHFKQDPGGKPRRITASADDEEEYLIYQFRNREGQVLLHSHDATADPFPVPLVPGYYDTATHRVFTDSAVSGTLFLQLADPLDHRREAMIETAAALLLPMLLLLPLSVLTIWYVVRRSLAPIGKLQTEISSRDGGNLEALNVDYLPPELGSIATSVDRLLDRLRAALENEREFAANSAHELRTPIAGALAQTQMLVRELPRGRAKERAQEIEASLSRLSHLAEKLLQLARADAGVGLSEEPADLVHVSRLIFTEFARKPTNEGRLKFEAPNGLVLRRSVDVDAFGIALRNLIENALLHGSKATPVVVAVSQEKLSVRNSGVVVPKAQLEQLTERFTRGSSQARGSGLGLAIAASITRHMGGTLELVSPASGMKEGFEAAILFPTKAVRS